MSILKYMIHLTVLLALIYMSDYCGTCFTEAFMNDWHINSLKKIAPNLKNITFGIVPYKILKSFLKPKSFSCFTKYGYKV